MSRAIPEATSAEWTIRFVGYHPVDDRVDERLRRVCEEIGNVPASAITVDEEARVVTIDYSQVRGWFEASRQFMHITRAGRIVVKPPWEQYEASGDELVVEIDPGAAFGSGLHETTQVCLNALQAQLSGDESVIDFGTGSGILAIAAAKLGASRVTAIDINRDSVEVARANVLRNGAEDVVEVFHTDQLPVGIRADLVAANITCTTIRETSDTLAELTQAGGKLIASGFGTAQVADVEDCLTRAGFEIDSSMNQDDWLAVIAIRSQQVK